jgi:proteasome activator subunit 4
MVELSTTKLPKRQRGQESSSEFQDLLIKRHGTVLILSALVLAFPYDIIDWMPNVLVAISRCASDPSPVGAEVSKTFSEFRRTHQDNWHEDKLKFTEDQLYDLSDLLVSSSYYA